MTDNTEALPPLPPAAYGNDCTTEEEAYTVDQMRDYARAALAQRQQVPETLRELIARSKLIADELDEVSLERATILELCAALTAPPSAQPDLEDYERWLDERLERSVALASAHTAPSARPAERKGCDYIAPLGSLCRKCGHVHGQRYTFWTGDGKAAMQPDPNGNWLWIGDPAKAPKGL